MTLPPETLRHTVTVLGSGGNVGSHTVKHLARLEEVERIVLVDPDTYSQANLRVQDIEARDVGRKKVEVQKRQVRRINPSVEVVALCAPVEQVPPAMLRSSVILACMDSKRSRLSANRLSLGLEIPWIDSGVDGTGGLARISLHFPGMERPCGICAWDSRHLAALEQRYPCTDGAETTAPTGAPSSLGGLAAALQVLHAQRYLAGELKPEDFGRELVLDTRHHRLLASSFRRNPDCLAEHEAWDAQPLARRPQELTLDDALSLAPGNGRRSLWLDASPFIGELTCHRCGTARKLLRHEAALLPRHDRCTSCRRRMLPVGSATSDRLEDDAFPRRILRRRLSSLGLRDGDVFAVAASGGTRRYELRRGTPS